MPSEVPRPLTRERRITRPMSNKACSPRFRCASGSKTVAAEIEGWLDHLGGERRYSPKTLEAYRRDVAQFLGFLAGASRRPRRR